MTSASSRLRSGGFSLVELMVAMAIGLILTLLIGQIFINSRAVFASTDNLSRLQENARYAMTLLSREIRTATYRSDPRMMNATPFVAPNLGMSGTDGGTTGSPASGVADKITLRFQGAGTAASGSADGTVQDCLGSRVDNNVMITNTFMIFNDPANGNEPTLYCNTDTVAPNTCGASCFPIVPGVENMQILYGEDITDGFSTAKFDGSADRWVTAGNVNIWDNVVSVRISLLMRTADRVADQPTPSSTKWTMSGTDVYAPGTDTRLRRVFTTVVNLRNRAQ
jgi:type IV pilus assembly protein PilW